jgi:hypothetical protein
MTDLRDCGVKSIIHMLGYIKPSNFRDALEHYSDEYDPKDILIMIRELENEYDMQFLPDVLTEWFCPACEKYTQDKFELGIPLCTCNLNIISSEE